jgi:3-hydroxyacyl-CoA dehydrogenase
MHITKVAIVGAGTMGSSIAMALLSRDIPVLLKDVDEAAITSGIEKIERLFQSRVKKGLTLEEAEQQRSLLQLTTSYDGFEEIDLIIEAVAEKIDIKRAVLQELDEVTNVNAIFASNTSSLSITQLGACTRRPDKVVGLHFFNPAHLMKLVEVVAGLDTSPDTVRTVIEFGQYIGKLSIRVEECASFLVNRLLGRYMNEALWCLQEGIAGVEEIDKAACDYAMPVGPLALRDMNGADIGLAVANFNFEEYGERFRPAPILSEMVARKWLGQKTGKGFYLYDPQTKKRTAANTEINPMLSGTGGRKGFSAERLFLPMINEAFLALQEKICNAEDLDPALMAGLGMRRGPLAIAADMGLGNCLTTMEKMFHEHGERFRPAPLLKRYVWAGRTTII